MNKFDKLLAVCCLTALSCPGFLSAQESDRGYIEEVVVTAQKREQSVQDVPIAVDAFTEDFLKDNNVEDVFDLQFFSPSIAVENGGGSVSVTTRLRGIGTQSSISLESSVGIYIDGVTRTRQQSVSTSLVDMERVEIVKGPQGTLFGRNAVSGAIQYVSVAPDDELGGWVSVDAGNHEFRNLKGAFNLPLGDTLAARVSGSWLERDGFIDNLVTGNEIHDMDRYSVRGQFLWTPSDDFSARLILDKTEFDEVCCTGTNAFDGPADSFEQFFANGGSIVPPARVPGVSAAVPQEAGNLLLGLIDPTGTRFPNGFPVNLAAQVEDREVTVNVDPESWMEEQGISLELNWDLNEDLTLTTITAYREFEARGEWDTDYTAYDSLSTNDIHGADQETFSQELRLTGSTDNMEYVLGAYYFKQEIDAIDGVDWGLDAWFHAGGGLSTAQFMSVGLIPGIPPNFIAFVTGQEQAYCEAAVADQFEPFCGPGISPFGADEFSANYSTQDQTNWAVFGQVDYNMREDLILTLGLRFTSDEKDIDMDFRESSLNPGFAFFTPLSPLTPGFSETVEDDVWTGTAKITWFMNDEVMFYASYGRGYKAGGFNTSRISLTPASNQVAGAEFYGTGVIVTPVELRASPVFDPEFVDSYEVGMKGDFMGGRLRANVSLFVSDFEDFQATAFVGNVFVLANAGELSSDGVEVTLQALPTDWLSLYTSVTYTDAEYDKFLDGPCDQTPYSVSTPLSCDNSGEKLSGTPEFAWVGSARAVRPIGNNWEGFAQIDVRWNDDTPYGADGDGDKMRDSYSLVNASLGLVSNDGRYEIMLWGRNLEDEQYYLGVFNAVGREGSLTTHHSEPRTYGITLRANF